MFYSALHGPGRRQLFSLELAYSRLITQYSILNTQYYGLNFHCLDRNLASVAYPLSCLMCC